jgi:hypothetical protein
MPLKKNRNENNRSGRGPCPAEVCKRKATASAFSASRIAHRRTSTLFEPCRRLMV